MNDTTIINMFNGDNTNIAYTNAQHFQTLAYMVLKIKKPIVANHTVFAVVSLCKINSFTHINSRTIQHLQYLIMKKYCIKIICHLIVLQFYKHICLHILAGNVFFRIQLKNQYKRL